jgi:hypothetical protein
MTVHRFHVFGRMFYVQREGSVWRAYSVGGEGKRVPAGIVIPDFIATDEIEQYLADIFHESATPANGEIRRLD